MDKEKQIEENLAFIIGVEQEFSETNHPVLDIENYLAEALYNSNYRKQNVGEWIESYSYGIWHYDCPFCKDGYAVEEREKSPENFCNNCGAKLDGARMEENV